MRHGINVVKLELITRLSGNQKHGNMRREEMNWTEQKIIQRIIMCLRRPSQVSDPKTYAALLITNN
jgi:hypothetical protein